MTRAVRGYGRRSLEPCEVYVLLARDGNGPAYVKIGRSNCPEARIPSVQTGCPVRITSARAIKCSSLAIARAMEESLHEHLASFRCSGEWFRFDWDDDAHRSLLDRAVEKHLAGMGLEIREIDLALAGKVRSKRVKDRVQQRRKVAEDRFRKEQIAVYHRSPSSIGF